MGPSHSTIRRTTARRFRRRKSAHHLPKVRDRDLDVSPPNIMWPGPGSGFEASPFSPAGTAQRVWWLIRGSARKRRTRWLIWVALAFVLSGPILLGVHALVGW